MKILFTNAGRRTYLLKYALEMRQDFPLLEIFASDASEATAAFYVSKEITPILTPPVSHGEEEYIAALLQECQRFGINAIIPLMDFEIPVLARHAGKFFDEGITLWVSSPAIVDAFLDKKRFHEFCQASGLLTPRAWFEDVARTFDFPVVRKRILGSGSAGLQFFEAGEALPPFDPDFMYQERILGQEFGMDVLNDLRGDFIHACARRKLLMRAGETDKAISCPGSHALHIGEKISAFTRHVGNLDLDYIEGPSGEIFFIDFNPRFGGGYPFTHHSGFNYLKCMLELTAGRSPAPFDEGRSVMGMKGIELFWKEA